MLKWKQEYEGVDAPALPCCT